MPRKKGKEPEREETPPLPLLPEHVAGRKAPEPEVVRWVSRNISNPRPDPEECPDPFAWTLLDQCRQSPSFTGFFIEKLWAKLLPSRSQIDASKVKGSLDGKPTLELIARIRELSEEAMVGDVAGVAGGGEDEELEAHERFEAWDPSTA